MSKPSAAELLDQRRCDRCTRAFVATRDHQRFCQAACRYAARCRDESVRYDKTHRELRARLAMTVAAGSAVCARCRLAILRGTPGIWGMSTAAARATTVDRSTARVTVRRREGRRSRQR